MWRRTVLAVAGAGLSAPLVGCLRADTAAEKDESGSEQYAVSEIAPERARGPREHAEETLSVLAASEKEVRALFAIDELEARDRERFQEFVDGTEFDRERMLSVEATVPDPDWFLEIEGVTTADDRGVLEVKIGHEPPDDGEETPAVELVGRRVVRVDLESASVDDLRVRYTSESHPRIEATEHQPIPVSELERT